MKPSPWFDIQVNGYAGIDFNQDDLAADRLHAACHMLAEHGCAGILATIITEDIAVMCRRISRLVELRAADSLVREMIAGIHVEGPFLNPAPGFRGAHPVDAIVPADRSSLSRLLDAGQGLIRLITLAPEQDPGLEVTRQLAGQGIRISAGHTDASLVQLEAFADAGGTLFTHLGNGCPAVLPRHDNIIQRVLHLRRRFCVSLIADGVHIPCPVLANYLDLLRDGGSFVITTDAMAAAGLGPGRYRLGRWDVQVGADHAARSPDGSHLVGSAVTMGAAVDLLRTQLALGKAEIARATFELPRAVAGVVRPL